MQEDYKEIEVDYHDLCKGDIIILDKELIVGVDHANGILINGLYVGNYRVFCKLFGSINGKLKIKRKLNGIEDLQIKHIKELEKFYKQKMSENNQ